MGISDIGEYIEIHREPLDGSSLALVLLRSGEKYTWLWDDYIGIDCERWATLEGLAVEAVRLMTYGEEPFIRMGYFIKEYVGEARYTLAVLETM